MFSLDMSIGANKSKKTFLEVTFCILYDVQGGSVHDVEQILIYFLDLKLLFNIVLSLFFSDVSERTRIAWKGAGRMHSLGFPTTS